MPGSISSRLIFVDWARRECPTRRCRKTILLWRKLDFDRAYVNPLSSVLADYVYNSLLTGRPYFLQMIEDAEIAIRFSRLKLHAGDVFCGQR